MPLTAGSRIGPYEVVAPLGVGGMGEVYRARDAKLNRDVALKVLPDAFALDADRLARFRREAQVLASLNHPHIAAIYGFEDSGEKHALVLELVEGPTLAERLEEQRAEGRGLPIDETLSAAKQIAEALEAAHEQGVIHRDLKPANIKLRPDGTVKVLDFGLAKALEPAPAVGATESPTITTPAMMTGVGVILGTAAYMSPEQARGRPAGKRSDVWAFGCVLYEMLTGKRAFDGEDVGETLAAVIKSEPDWNALPRDVPPAVRTLLERCLEKDPRKRVAESSTASFVLREPSIAKPPAAGASPSARSSPGFVRRAWPIAAAALIAGAVVGAALRWMTAPVARPAVVRFQLTPAEGEGSIVGAFRMMAVSPDGSQLAYTTDKGLYVRAISSATSRLVAGSDQSLTEPAFSPDGRSIAFVSLSDRQLKVVPVAGGTAIALSPIELPATVSWTTDSIVFGQPTGVMRVSPNGGAVEQLVRVKAGESALAPQLLADGQTLLFTLPVAGVDRDSWQIVAQSLKTGSRRTLVPGGSHSQVVPTGHLLYIRAGVLFAVRFDQAAVRVTGEPVPVLEGVARGAPAAAQYAVSDSGSLVYLPGPVLPSSRVGRLATVDEKGSVVPLTPSAGAYAWPRIAPDGRQIAYGLQEAQGFNIWIYQLDGRSAARRLTFGGNNRFPVWSPDSRHLVFQSDRGGDLALFRQPADVTGESAERITRADAGTAHVPESWSRPQDILSVSVVKGATTTLSTLSMRDRKMTPFGNVRSTNMLNSEFSPDGHWIAYTVRGGASVTMINVEPFPATGEKSQISKPDELAHHALWAPDGKSLFYVPGNQPVVAVSITTRPAFSAGNPFTAPGNVPNTNPFGEPRNFDIAPDGRRWVTVVDPTAPASTLVSGAAQMQVVLNWFEELTQRVPVK